MDGRWGQRYYKTQHRKEKLLFRVAKVFLLNCKYSGICPRNHFSKSSAVSGKSSILSRKSILRHLNSNPTVFFLLFIYLYTFVWTIKQYKTVTMAHNGELSSCDECNTTCADLSISFMEVYIHEMLQYGLNLLLLLLLLLMMMTWLYSIRGGSIAGVGN